MGIKLIAFDLFNPMLHGGDIRILIGGVLGVVALICGVIGLLIVAINVFAKKVNYKWFLQFVLL